MTQQIIFIRGEIFPREEGENVEFKTIESQNPVNKILQHAEEYIIGFLNASVEGELYLGIDDSGKILGINLNRSQRDEILRNIANKLRNTDPVVPISCYKLLIHDVYDLKQNQIEDLCVVQIHVDRVEEDFLYRASKNESWFYRTAGGSVYFKKDSNCFKLTSEEIAKEIKNREQKHLRKELKEINCKLVENPENISLLYEKAKVAKYLKDIDSMDEAYNKLISLNPKNYKTKVYYASAHKSIGDVEGALTIINDALKIHKNNTDLLKQQGDILLVTDRVQEAFQSYQEALVLNPDDYTIITQIGIVLREMGEYKESINCFNHALSKSPSYRAAKYERKLTYSKIFAGGIEVKTNN